MQAVGKWWSASLPAVRYPVQVALSPAGVSTLLKEGFKSVVIDKGAGENSKFTVRRFLRHLLPFAYCRAMHGLFRLPECAACSFICRLDARGRMLQVLQCHTRSSFVSRTRTRTETEGCIIFSAG